MAEVISLGKIAVSTPGTPVRVSSDLTLFAAKIIFSGDPADTTRVWIGKAGLNKTTKEAVISSIPGTPAGSIATTPTGSVEISASDCGNQLQVSDFYVDADTAAQGPIVSFVVN
jgi:hypothetical protein